MSPLFLGMQWWNPDLLPLCHLLLRHNPHTIGSLTARRQWTYEIKILKSMLFSKRRISDRREHGQVMVCQPIVFYYILLVEAVTAHSD